MKPGMKIRSALCHPRVFHIQVNFCWIYGVTNMSADYFVLLFSLLPPGSLCSSGKEWILVKCPFAELKQKKMVVFGPSIDWSWLDFHRYHQNEEGCISILESSSFATGKLGEMREMNGELQTIELQMTVVGMHPLKRENGWLVTVNMSMIMNDGRACS